jgi:hypothetical protein
MLGSARVRLGDPVLTAYHFRLLELDDAGDRSEAVDADAIRRELGPVVARRR